jgi:4-hydroxybenzoate polyprenyltransferase
MVAQFIHEIVHLNIDKRENIITTVAFFDENMIKKFCYLFFCLALLISLYLFFFEIINILFLISTILFVVFFAIAIRKEKINEKLRKRYRIFGIIVGLIYLISLMIGI